MELETVILNEITQAKKKKKIIYLQLWMFHLKYS